MNTRSYSEIAKGVKLLCIKSDKFKTNCIRIDFCLPITEQLAAQNVLSSFMGHTSKRYKTVKEFNSKVESLYGADFDSGIMCTGEYAKIRFAIEVPDDRFSLDGQSISEAAVDFLVDIISNPNAENGRFQEENTAREIRFTLESIEAEKNDKRSYALSRLRQLMCENEPYGIDRERLENDVRKLDSKALFEAYENMLKTATIVITACGSLDGEMLKNKFAAFANGIADREIAKLESIFIEKAEGTRYFKETMDITQAKLVMGLRTGMRNADDNYFSYRVMTDIFGGGPYSRLFMNVREKMSLCYYCNARIVRDKGIIFIQSGIENQNYEKAKNEILNQLDIMKKGEFTDEEFDSSISALCDSFRGVEDSPAAVCTFYGSQALDETLVSGKEYAGLIAGVTRRQVTECAKKVTVDSIYLLTGEEKGNE